MDTRPEKPPGTEEAPDILLVEDNLHDVELVLRALRRGGPAASVLHLRDGAEALAYLFESTERPLPRLVLLDLKLPKVDGLEVLRRIKENGRTRTIPVVMLTSSSEESDVRRSYSLGVNSYVVKPVNYDEFVRAVTDVGHYWLAMNRPDAVAGGPGAGGGA